MKTSQVIERFEMWYNNRKRLGLDVVIMDEVLTKLRKLVELEKIQDSFKTNRGREFGNKCPTCNNEIEVK